MTVINQPGYGGEAEHIEVEPWPEITGVGPGYHPSAIGQQQRKAVEIRAAPSVEPHGFNEPKHRADEQQGDKNPSLMNTGDQDGEIDQRDQGDVEKEGQALARSGENFRNRE